MSRIPLLGFLLAGGQSRRMGKAKASLSYAGSTQPERVAKLLQAHCNEVFLSLREEQAMPAEMGTLSVVRDSREGGGPLVGILSAFDARTDAAWLVVACDLPFLDAATLDNLLAKRDSTRLATAYRSAHDGLPEPLCTIYEPHARPVLEDYLARDIRCPRKILINTEPLLLDPVNPRALDNVNTPEDYEEAVHILSSS